MFEFSGELIGRTDRDDIAGIPSARTLALGI